MHASSSATKRIGLAVLISAVSMAMALPAGVSAGNPAPSSVPSTDRPQATGGPDNFGYTWNDGLPFTWVDATGGVDTHVSFNTTPLPVNLGFPFMYYEDTYSSAYIGSGGAIGFSSPYFNDSPPSSVPAPNQPANFIAPFDSFLSVNFPSTGFTGTVYYLAGGLMPNRYFVVEWFQAGDLNHGNYTFELVLHENGNLEFNYQYMSLPAGGACAQYGIAQENAFGDDGLAYVQAGCHNANTLTGKTVAITRPAAAARAQVDPTRQGVLVAPDGKATLQLTLRNTGALGVDTFDLTAASAWPLTFYAADGTTPLTDTNANVTVDTGPLPTGSTFTATVSALVPLTATIGSTVVMTITARSAITTSSAWTVALQAAVPASFAQVYDETADGALNVLLARPQAQVVKQVTSDSHLPLPFSSGYVADMAVAETPDGGFVYAWANDGAIKYTLLDKAGNTLKPVSVLSAPNCNTGIGNDWHCASQPVLAVVPDGHIAIAWHVDYMFVRSAGTELDVAFLDQSGTVVRGPVWLGFGASDGGCASPISSNPRLAGSGDNHFVIAWTIGVSTPAAQGCTTINDIYVAAANSTGANFTPAVKLTSSNDTHSYQPTAIFALNANRVLLAYQSAPSGDLFYSVLDSTGNTIKAQTPVGSTGDGLVGAQLSNGPIALAWIHGNSVQVAALDAGYNLVKGPTTLASPAGVPHSNLFYPFGTLSSLAAAADINGHAILTWDESSINLYYALVNGAGGVVTAPTIFHTSGGLNTTVSTSNIGQGNTSYHFGPANGVDLGLALSPALAAVLPGATVDYHVRETNYGLTLATGIELTATVGNGLTYLGDTTGITATLNGNTVVWDLPAQQYGDHQAFTLTVGVPLTASLGTHYALGVVVKSNQTDANPVDNAASTDVFVAYQSFLPVINNIAVEGLGAPVFPARR